MAGTDNNAMPAAVAAAVNISGTITTTTPDASNAALGATSDAAVTNPASTASLIAITKGVLTETAAVAAAVSGGIVQDNIAKVGGSNIALGQNTMANSLPVVIASNQGAVPASVADGSSATLGAKADSAITDSTTTNSAMSFFKGIVKILADAWDSTNHLFHGNIKQVGATAIDTNSGSKSAGTIRVTLATDQVQLTNSLLVTGDVASAAADSGNPVKQGFYASSTNPMANTTAANRINALSDLAGRQVILPFTVPENTVFGTTADITDNTTSTAIISSQGSGNRICPVEISISNLSATVSTRVDIQDGSGGTVVWQFVAPALGGVVQTFVVPKRGSTATGLYAQCGTTGAQVRVSVGAYVSK